MKQQIARILAFWLTTTGILFASALEEPMGSFGGEESDWAGPWTLYAPAHGVLDVQMQTDSIRGHGFLALNARSDGPRDAGTAQHSVGMYREYSPQIVGSDYTLQFGFWIQDVGAFLKRGSGFGFLSTDRASIAGLSSRSSWNLICYGADTPVGPTVLQAGELGLRAIPQGSGDVATLPTGIFMESMTPVEVTIRINAAQSTFDIQLQQGGQSFEATGLGYWAQRTNFAERYFNVFTFTYPWDGFSIYMNDLTLRP